MFGSTFNVWPAEPPAPPPVVPEIVEVARPGWLRFVELAAGAVELPTDFAIREIRDTSTDDESLAAFASQWGLLHGPGPAALDLLPANFLPLHGTPEMIEAGDVAVETPALWSLDVSRIHIQVLRALGEVYLGRALFDERRVGLAWRSAGFSVADEDVTWQQSERVAWHVINAAVSGFAVRVSFGGQALPAFAANTYSASVLQLVQAMATSGRTVLRCENDRCGRAFTRQRGRSRYAEQQHTQGVKYCSHACAKAQLERNRRARLKGEL